VSNVDYPDWTRGLTIIPGNIALSATQDYPDWTDGVVDITGNIVAGQDFPDWVKAVGQITVAITSPLQISGCQYWYDASQITGVADNTALASWSDLSGNGYTLIQPGAAKPTYFKTTGAKLVNGLPAVWYVAASSQVMSTTAVPNIIGAGNTYTAFAVAQPASNPAGAAAVASQIITANPTYFNATRLSGSICAVARNTGSTPFIGSAGSATIGQPFRTGSIVDATPEVICRSAGVAGTPTAITGTSANGGVAINIGGAPGAAAYWDGAICEAFFYRGLLTASQITSVELYLQNKWGTP
jgi:hypothetical protein